MNSPMVDQCGGPMKEKIKILRGYKTELDLNNRQRTHCRQHAGTARFAYNWGVRSVHSKSYLKIQGLSGKDR
jgi:hypothetical protein